MTFKPRYVSIAVITLACITPVLVLVLLSLSQSWVYPKVIPGRLSVSQWREAFRQNTGIANSLYITLLLAAAVAVISTTSGFICSKWIAYHKHKKRLLLLAYLPFVLSPVILAVCLKFYFIKLNLAGTFVGVLLAQLVIAFPYSTIFFTGFWNRQMLQYEQLVKTLGGSQGYAFKMVIVPAAKPLLLICFFQCFLIAWFEYGLTSVIGYGKVPTLTIKVYQFVTEVNIYYAALSCCLLVLPPILLLWINKRIIFRQVK